ncbi:hypothetical protein BS50DRAFT_674721 [Corynespora cassiicola Philippines]|uniref:Carrier domain-containing protein n=1 Tax=Corynespora cassiicola Philippines TaxID=1448308 RepID=A0A2T2NY12_CORCC|nr:hypothetical protein BS50DRAFT_674721 [Corynespora cassiicola Philippines]
MQAKGMDILGVMQRPLSAGFSKSDGTAVAGKEDGLDSATLFKQAVTEYAKKDIAIQALAFKLGRPLSMSPDDIDAKPLFEYGANSLVAVDLRSWIRKHFATDKAVFDIIGGSTIEVVGALVAKRAVQAKNDRSD